MDTADHLTAPRNRNRTPSLTGARDPWQMTQGPTEPGAVTEPSPAAALRGRLPSRIADVWSICADLDFVAGCCDELLADPPEDDSAEPSVVRRALWEAAVISYGRCFRSGKSPLEAGETRFRIPDSVIDGLGSAALETHDFTLGARDRHIAHRVNDDEQVEVVAFLAPPPAPRAVEGVTAWGVHLVEPFVPRIESLRDLARTLHAMSQADLRGLIDKAIQLGNGEYHLDRLYKTASSGHPGSLAE